jgi:hypothetical protein
MDGFDAGDYTLKGWRTFVSGGGAGIGTTTGRVSGNAIYADQGTVGTASAGFQRTIPATTQITLGMAMRYTGGVGSGTFVISLYGDGGSTQHLTIMSDINSKAIVLRLGSTSGTVLQTSAQTFTPGAWEYLEIQATIADAGGICKVRLNGNPTLAIDYTGDTKNAGTGTSFTQVYMGVLRSNTNNDTAAFDDFYVLDGTGASNNTFLGDVRVATLRPSAAGTDTQLTPTGVATNWQNVDETTYSATDYNASSTSGQRDTYALDNLPSGTSTVFALQSNLIAAKSDVTNLTARVPLRVNGSLYYSPTYALNVSYLNYVSLHATNPDTSLAWTPSEVNSLEAGMEVV